ncbi:hypothetical protein K474DRAFT_480833 [Panus rudis PR-1116 ss-1]|nr:hypothetical protein K474DRAFT_480833 [Panus rudis PR-1116 ss-1]
MNFSHDRGPVFPLEICGMVIRECCIPILDNGMALWTTYKVWRDRTSTLWNCSLTCRGWHQYAQPLLFRTICAGDNDRDYRSIHNLAAIVHEKPELGRLVKSLIIDARRTGDPSWIAVTLHSHWFPNLADLTLLISCDYDLHHIPRSFSRILTTYRSSVQQLYLHYNDVLGASRPKGLEKTTVLHALSFLTNITHLQVNFVNTTTSLRYPMVPPPRNPPGSNMLRSLIVRGLDTPYGADDIVIPLVKKGTISLESLEFLRVTFRSVVRTSGLIRECTGSLRELYLVEYFDFKMSRRDGLYSLDPSSSIDISLSSLHGLRQLYCSDIAVSHIISMLNTLPIPSTLTQLDVAGSSIKFDAINKDTGFLVSDDTPWRELDTALSSSAFPLLCSLNIMIVFYTDDSNRTYQKKAKEKLEDWLSGCFSRGIVRLTTTYEHGHYADKLFDDLDKARRHLGFIDP